MAPPLQRQLTRSVHMMLSVVCFILLLHTEFDMVKTAPPPLLHIWILRFFKSQAIILLW